MPTRTCVVCQGDKPVSGVWYLLPPRAGRRATPFVCESCFRLQAPEPPA
ncbi:MAG TPA: hypothetical protein VGR28_06140 [Candidatus Thermoplasmatota archaeon]|nr:hypothetical protein [Candidatus Thermoplasmatota archaeon]